MDPCTTPAPPVYQTPVYQAPVYQTPVYQQTSQYGAWHPSRPVYEQPLAISNTKIFAHSSEYIGPFGTMGRGWGLVALSQPTRIDNGREDFIVRQGGFNTIQLRATAGSSFIRQVTIEFMDESAQVIQLQKTLDRRAPAINLDVRGSNRQVKRILVYGSTATNSSYQVFAA
ncbi:MAG: hypothetical protein ABI867_43270 [Kofleriaceae bacterium]